MSKTKGYFLVITLSAYICLLFAQASAAPETENNCIQCHEFIRGQMGKPVFQWYGSSHQIEGITCDQCHGGNPDIEIEDFPALSPDALRNLSKRAMYAEPSFVGAPSGQAQFELCATCHPEATETYTASIMGQAFLLKKGGPSCTQCHGAHRNVIPPVPKSCTSCHQDTTGYERLEAMNISEETVRELSRIRIQIAGEKVAGKGPLFQQHLESFEAGIVSWGMVLVLFLAAVGLHWLVERRHK
ncbi:MAG: hypothetical protein JRG73_14155 [Deltaproteobacteria bacterium]|nr:hypothetical protein [Deltaproteobacteria bacterium]MBW2308066.1 hypothetical protein [Deltaproteobacteria bacterium]